MPPEVWPAPWALRDGQGQLSSISGKLREVVRAKKFSKASESWGVLTCFSSFVPGCQTIQTQMGFSLGSENKTTWPVYQGHLESFP